MNRHPLSAAIAFILVLLSAAGGAAGETLSGAPPVRLAEATEMAMKGKPEILVEIEKERLAQSKVKEARGNFLPTLDLLASSYYVENFDTFTGINISARIANQDVSAVIEKVVPPYQVNPELYFGWNLYAAGRDRALLREALNSLEAAHHQESAARRKIRLEVARSYWGLKKAQVQYAIANRVVEVTRLELKVAETEHRLERRSDIDYDAVLLKSREREVALKAADRERVRAFSSYLHALGMDEEGTAPPSSAEIPELLDDPGSEEDLTGKAPVHPDILRLDSELRAACEREEAARSENYPKIDFFAKHSMVGRDSISYFDSLGDTRSEYYMIGLKVTMNLFNGLRTQERINQTDAEVRARRLQLVQKKRELAEAERVRKAELERAQDDLLLAVERKKLEEARVKAAGSQIQSGRISQLEYRQRTVDVENADDEILKARVEVALARNALELMVLE